MMIHIHKFQNMIAIQNSSAAFDMVMLVFVSGIYLICPIVSGADRVRCI